MNEQWIVCVEATRSPVYVHNDPRKIKDFIDRMFGITGFIIYEVDSDGHCHGVPVGIPEIIE